MSKEPKKTKIAASPAPNKPDFVEPSKLNFDLQNPRFVDLDFSNEEAVVQYLFDHADVNELMQSILSAGYIDFEPLVVWSKGNTVLEGNRRLAALRLIADGNLRKKLKIALPEIPNPKALPDTVRVMWVDSPEEARAFIGFKHINGPYKWGAMSKAKYAATWFLDGGDIAVISRTLGDNHSTVRRLVNGYFALQQAIADGFDLNQISKKNFSFSHLYTALTRASVRDFLGIDGEDLSAEPKQEPVSPKHRDDLQRLMSWLY